MKDTDIITTTTEIKVAIAITTIIVIKGTTITIIAVQLEITHMVAHLLPIRVGRWIMTANPTTKVAIEATGITIMLAIITTAMRTTGASCPIEIVRSEIPLTPVIWGIVIDLIMVAPQIITVKMIARLIGHLDSITTTDLVKEKTISTKVTLNIRMKEVAHKDTEVINIICLTGREVVTTTTIGLINTMATIKVMAVIGQW